MNEAPFFSGDPPLRSDNDELRITAQTPETTELIKNQVDIMQSKHFCRNRVQIKIGS